MRKTTALCVYEPSSLPRLSTQNMLISANSTQFVLMARVDLEMGIMGENIQMIQPPITLCYESIYYE